MRLWHKDLIAVLPRQQLLGQWRECCAIARNISVNGRPNHILVNKIMDYPIDHFCTYTDAVISEMLGRGYKVHHGNFWRWFDKKPFDLCAVSDNDLFADWHNDRYLMQCYCNLQEKYDCGGITEMEWFYITKVYCERMNNNG